jgi:hypothetical protein
MMWRRLRAASSISSSACATLAVKGFFDKYVLALVQSGLGQLEVRPHRSYDGNHIDLWALQNFLGFRYDLDMRESFLARRCDFSLLSAIATTCDTPGRLKLRATFGPQYPYPITPTLIMNSPIDSLSKKWSFAEPIFWGDVACRHGRRALLAFHVSPISNH